MTVTVNVAVFPELCAGVPAPVTVNVYWPEVVPGLPPPPLLLPPPPQAARLPRAIISTSTPKRARQLRRRAGMPRNNSRASATPSPSPSQPPTFGFTRAAVFGVVDTDAVAVPLGVPLVNVIVEPVLTEHEGRFEAPLGDDVSAQDSATGPV